MSVDALDVLPAAFVAVTASLYVVLQARPPSVNDVSPVFPANRLFAVMSYSVAPADADQPVEIVDALDPVTPSELGGLGGLDSWLRYGLSVWLEAWAGATARSSELVVAATEIARRQAEVAKLPALSFTNTRICSPEDETPLSLPTCAGPASRTATIEPAEALRDSAIALASDAVAAHTV